MAKPIGSGGTPKFALEEIVFVKIKGWRPWPAKVEFFEYIPSTNDVKYNVYFYGTNQIAQCKEKDIFSYIEYREEFGKPNKAPGFMTAISQADSELQLRDKSQRINEQDSELSHLEFLTTELQVLKIDKGIKSSLNLNRPHLDTCIKLLDEYCDLNLTTLIFKKNPQLIDTLLKLQVYSGNDSVKTSSADEKLIFEQQMCLIRKKAWILFHHVQSLFTIPSGKLFFDHFVEVLNEFKKDVEGMTENELLKLTQDPTANRILLGSLPRPHH